MKKRVSASVAAAVFSLLLLAAGDGLAGDGGAAQVRKLRDEASAQALGARERFVRYRPKFEALAQRHAGAQGGLDARLWLLAGSWQLRDEGKMESFAAKVADELTLLYPRSPELALVPIYGYMLGAKDRRRIFERIRRDSPLPEVQGSAIYGLAQGAADATEARRHFRTLLEDYSDVAFRYTTFGELADAHLNPHSESDLAVGRKAPEIVGRSADGKALRLSQFRGKVVVLKFWGDW